MIPKAIYLLCLAASLLCASLLLRSYLREKTPLLFWSAACFLLLSLNNFLVVSDLIIFPGVDLLPWRRLSSLAAIGALLFGFIWRSEA
ncbi:DUF5985 family protein [Alsobacter sp. SYSU BS001988]|jgi:hypothetical protein